MYKKKVGGRRYYYTTYRDKDGKVRTKYLGDNSLEASKEERKVKTKKKITLPPKFLGMLLVLLLIGTLSVTLYYNFDNITGFVTIQEEEVEVQEDTWYTIAQEEDLLIDSLSISPIIAYANTTLNCNVGVLNATINKTVFMWYVNKTYTHYTNNASSLTSGNFSIRDHVDCSVIPVTNSLLAYWSFDNQQGDYVPEHVNNNSGNYDPIGFSNEAGGKFYASANLGLIENITIRDPVGINFSKNFTVAFWKKDASTNNANILKFGSFEIFQISGKLRVKVNLTSEGANTIALARTNAALDEWDHWAITYNGTQATLYKNGVEDNSTIYTKTMDQINGSIYIGRWPEANLQHEGKLDELVFYNQSLNQQEIDNLYRRGVAISSVNSSVNTDSIQADFLNGTCLQTNCTGGGNVTLSTSSPGAFLLNGTFESKIIDNIQEAMDAKLFFLNKTPAGTNLSLKIRTGIQGDNRTIRWSEYSGPDPSHSYGEPGFMIGIDFAEYDTNVTKDTIETVELDLQDNSFIPQGKHGSGAEFHGATKAILAFSGAHRLINKDNYSLEIWVKPNQASKAYGLLEKAEHYLFTNASGYIGFNTSNLDSTTTNVQTNTLLENDVWTYILVTRSTTDNQTYVYVNGLNAGNTSTNAILSTGSQPLDIGGGSGDNFNGTIDSVVMWNKTFTASEVYEKYMDRFTNSTGGQKVGRLNRYTQYVANFSTDSTSNSPALEAVTIQYANKTTYIYSHKPNSVSLGEPANNTIIGSGQQLFNWTSSADIDSDELFYDFIISNKSTLNEPNRDHALAINNYSTVDYSDDNNTVFIEHFTNREEVSNHTWVIDSWAGKKVKGRFGNGWNMNSTGAITKYPALPLSYQQGTIEFWIQPTWNGNESGENYFFDHAQPNQLELNRSGSMLYYQVGVTNYLTYNITNWTEHEWYHIATTWQSDRNMSLIIDGIKVNQTTISSLTQGLTGYFYLGTNFLDNYKAHVTFDELRVSSVARRSFNDLSSLNISSANATLYGDGRYFWRVRAGGYTTFGEKISQVFSDWADGTFIFDVQNVSITSYPQDKFRKTLSLNKLNYSLTTSESSTCYQKQYMDTDWHVFNTTGNIEHEFEFGYQNYANYSLLFQCYDIGNKSVNFTAPFYALDTSNGTVYFNSSNIDFVAGDRTSYTLNRQTVGEMGAIVLATQNNVTGKVLLVEHNGINNPEKNDLPPANKTIRYYTWIVDQHIVNNMTGNASIDMKWSITDFPGTIIGSEKLFWYNHTLDNWSQIVPSYGITPANKILTHNTTFFGTFAITGDLEAATVAVVPNTTVVAEAALDEEETYTLLYDVSPVYADELQVIDILDTVTGIIELVFISNKDKDLASIRIGRDYSKADEAYKDFYIQGVNFEKEELDYLEITYAIEKRWVENNEGTLAVVDSDGNQYPLEFSDDDEDFYYFYAILNTFGKFEVYALEELTNLADLDESDSEKEEEITSEEESEEKTEEGGTEEEEEEGIAEYSAFFSESPSINFLLALLYLAIVGVCGYFISKLGVAAILSRKQVYPIKEEDLLIEEPIDSLRTVKYFIYKNQHLDNLHDRLIQDGYDKESAHKIINKVSKLEKGELPNYIFAQLSIGKRPQEIVQKLSEQGWENKIVEKHIDHFRRI
jgi:hypothetical protein